MTVEIKVANIEKIIEDKIGKAVDAAIDQSLADDVANQVKIRTQLGFGVDENGKQVKLKPLSESYRAQRRGDVVFYKDEQGRLRHFVPDRPPVLSSSTTPAKSNLTNRGEMLESLTGSAKNNEISVKVSGRRKDGSGLTNEEVREYVESQGRNFLALTNGEKNEVIREIKNRVLRNL